MEFHIVYSTMRPFDHYKISVKYRRKITDENLFVDKISLPTNFTDIKFYDQFIDKVTNKKIYRQIICR